MLDFGAQADAADDRGGKQRQDVARWHPPVVAIILKNEGGRLRAKMPTLTQQAVDPTREPTR
jgi:hypothetical protein